MLVVVYQVIYSNRHTNIFNDTKGEKSVSHIEHLKVLTYKVSSAVDDVLQGLVVRVLCH